MSTAILGSLPGWTSTHPGTPRELNLKPPKSCFTTSRDGEEDQIRLFLDCYGSHVQRLCGDDSGEYCVHEDALNSDQESLGLLASGAGDKVQSPPSARSSWNSLLSGCCLTVREVAFTASQFHLVHICDSYIRKNLTDMLNRKDILALPRLQVNINVRDENPHEVWTTGSPVMDKVLMAVVRELHELSAHKNGEVLVEKLMEMDLQSDLTVMLPSSKKSSKYLSPAKPMSDYINLAKKHPSPARKLLLGDNLECLGTNEETNLPAPKDWSVIGSLNVSSSAVVSVINRNRDEGLVVLNIQLVSKDNTNSACPISPTTGVPLSTGSTLLSQMLAARSGFGLVAVGETLVSLGGFNRNGVLSEVECYNRRINSWSPASKLVSKRARMGVAQYKDSVFAIGGSDGRFELNSVEEFDLNNGNRWHLLDAKLRTARSDFGMTILGDVIYAIGGTSYSRTLKTAETLDLNDQKWRTIPSLQIPRKGSAAVACNGKIFAIGGQQFSWNCLSSVECYNPSTNQWAAVSPLSGPRRNASAIVMEDKIFVMGGYNGSKAVSMVESYDPVTDTWEIVEPLAVSRSGASAVVVEGTIFVVGGYTGRCFLNSMETYDTAKKNWTSLIE